MSSDHVASWQTLSTALDLAPTGIVVSDRAGRWLYVNTTFAAMVGAKPEDLVGLSILDVIHPDDVVVALNALQTLGGSNADPAGTEVHLRMMRRDGTAVSIRARATVLAPDADSGEEHRVTVLEDRTRKLAARERQVQDERRLQSLLDGTGALIFVKDTSFVYRQVNAAFARVAGRSVAECLGRTDFELFPREIAEVYRANDEALLASRERHTREVPVDDPLLGLRTYSAAKFLLHDGDEVWGLACVGHDVTDQVRLRADLQTAAQERSDEARTDTVTGLPNRRVLVEAAEAALAVGSTGACLVFCDLDGFKEVNDTFGHETGDALLTAIGASLQGAVRPGDVVGRWGGDEFVVVCAGPPSAAAEGQLRARIRAAIASVQLPGGEPAAGSVGIARAHPGDDVAQALAVADHDMYEQKRSRRGTLPRPRSNS